jgi:hypothetical protein
MSVSDPSGSGDESGCDPQSVTASDTQSDQSHLVDGAENPTVISDPIKSSRTQLWGLAHKALGQVSTRVSTSGAAVASKAASLGTSGVAKAAEFGKQTYVAAGNAVEASGASEAIKATAGAVSGKLDEVSGKRLVELLEQKLRIQDSYNDILATRLAEALQRISNLESRIGELTAVQTAPASQEGI